MTSISPVVRWSAGVVGLLSALFALPACSQKSAEKCADAQKVARQAVEGQNFDSARQWREYAYKHCEDAAALAALDKELVDREAAIKAETERTEKRKAESAQLVKLFLDFVAQNRAAPDRAAAAPTCEAPPEGAPASKQKDRFCTGARVAGPFTLAARYWEADPTAVRFTTTPEDPVDCAALGGVVAKTWGVPAVGGKTAERSRCTLGGPLSGLTAVVSKAEKADVHVFSASYVERDPGSRPMLEGP